MTALGIGVTHPRILPTNIKNTEVKQLFRNNIKITMFETGLWLKDTAKHHSKTAGTDVSFRKPNVSLALGLRSLQTGVIETKYFEGQLLPFQCKWTGGFWKTSM